MTAGNMIDKTTVQLMASMAALERIQRHVASTMILVGHRAGGVDQDARQALVEVGDEVRDRTFEGEA